ncbi:MAG: helix-turn-helix domain-containing protein [Bacteroidales bacterium]|nr:helix-turn-helix domain-containing protein [Lachnoclostridium sp.]MCM1385602.1 helix-turn-helix domain-containing protein [Lachnoclostridium sp.]MCM1466327.1 helix-turn-helix domain-containing protein [Bacteroidales bacterium]
MNFSEKLKEIRKNEGISQEQLAEKIGVSRQAITKWETGKGLPDVENMVIIAEIFKTTIDELLMDSVAKTTPEASVYTSETIYDIDCEKHFDVHIGSAATILLSSGDDEKLHIKLSSETLENLGSMFKIKLDEKKNKLDVLCLNKDKLSRYEAEEALTVEIVLPNKYSDTCEIAAGVKLLAINNLHLNRLEYDGDAEQILISDSSGSLEFTAKTDYEITVDKITGRLDINQWKAKAIIHIPEDNRVNVINKGRKCNIYYVKDGNAVKHESGADSERIADSGNVLSISGIFSELIVDYK